MTRHPLLLAMLLLPLASAAFASADDKEPASPGCGCASSKGEGAEGGEKLSANVCPQYVWMDYGSYRSYYATVCDTCSGASWDTTLEEVTTGGDCSEDPCSCPYAAYVKVDGKLQLRPNHPGKDGYNEPRLLTRKDIDPQNPEAAFDIDQKYMKLLDAQEYVIKFKKDPRVAGNEEDNTAYAQIFIVTVKPIKRAKPEIQRLPPPGVLFRGHEIEPQAEVDVDIDFTDSEGETADRRYFRRPATLPHALVLPFADLEIEIITHKDTSMPPD